MTSRLQKTSILLFTLSFSVLFLAAAKAPVGTVPENEPLQPLPEFTKPNVEHSVNNGTNTAAEETDADATENRAVNSAVLPDGTPEIIADDIPPLEAPSSNFWLYAGAVVVALGGVIALIIRFQKGSSQKS